MTDRVWRINSEVLPNEWGAPYGLKELPRVGREDGLIAILDARKETLIAEARRVTREAERTLFDHIRTFKQVGKSTAVAFVSAPYLRATLGTFGTTAAVNARIHDIAESLGLRVRVGHPADVIYLSNNDDDPTLPIVWWNPARFEMPLPTIADPNPGYSHRMA